MSLPLTNLTFHGDPTANTDLWEHWQAGTPYHNTAATNGITVQVWDDVEHGSYMWYGSPAPSYRSTTPLMLHPCIEFNGSNTVGLLADDITATAQAMSVILAAGAKTLAFALYVQGIATNQTGANVYLNDQVIASNYNFGIALRDNGSATADANGISSRYKIIAWNDSGTVQQIELSISLNTSFVVYVTHDGTNMTLAVDNGTVRSVASGNTADVTGSLKMGHGYSGSGFANLRIAEHAIYNAALTGTPLSDLKAYFAAGWAPPAAPTTQTVTGPSSGTTGVASSNFTITLDLPATSTITFTPAGTVGTNTFSPSSPQITAGNSTVTFTDTAAIDGTHVVTVTDNAGLTDVGSVNYVTAAATLGADTLINRSCGMAYLGDFALGSNIDTKFTATAAGTGLPTTLAGSPALAAYPANSATEIATGITLSVDHDSRTGMNHVRVAATSGNGYLTATDYNIVLTAGTVGGTSVAGYTVAAFSIENRSALRPVTPGRTVVVDAAGLVDSTTVKVGPTGAATAQTAANLKTSIDAITAAAVPDSSLGIADRGVASAAPTANTLTLAGGSPHLFNNNALRGGWAWVKGSTSHINWESINILSNTGADPVVVTMTDNYMITPTGVVDYIIWDSPAGSAAHPPIVSLGGILGTLLTEDVAGYLAASFKKQYNVTGAVFTALSVNQSIDNVSAASLAASVRDISNAAPTAGSLGAAINTNGVLDAFIKAFLTNGEFTNVTTTTANYRVWPVGTAHVVGTGELAIIPVVRADAVSPWIKSTL